MPKKAKKKAPSAKKAATNTQSKAKSAKPAAKAPAKKKAAAPKKAAASKSKGTGKRYSAAERAKVLDFVNEVNSKKGRGGAAAASRKFGISQITIGQWVKKSGSKAAPKKAAGKKPGRKPGRKPAGQTAGFSAKLRRLADVHETIAKMKTELASLEAEYAKLKKSL